MGRSAYLCLYVVELPQVPCSLYVLVHLLLCPTLEAVDYVSCELRIISAFGV
jgi:hypothetical protein